MNIHYYLSVCLLITQVKVAKLRQGGGWSEVIF